MNAKLFLILFILVTFSSCAKKSVFSSNISPTEINDMAVFEPISYINIIYKGDKSVYSDSLSRVSQKLWLSTLELNRYRLPIDTYIILDDDFNRTLIEQETRNLFDEIDLLDQFYSIPIPPALKSQLEVSGNRFGMLTLTSGFTRTKGNLTGQMFKSIGIGLLTLGMVMIIPETAQSNVYVMILDNELDEVVYYKASTSEEMQPLKEKNLHRQLEHLYKDYFW